MEDFSSTGQLVTLCLVDSSIGAMAKRLALVDVKALIVKDMLHIIHIHSLDQDLILVLHRVLHVKLKAVRL